jgi:translation initiation factor 6 (eIF-6)
VCRTELRKALDESVTLINDIVAFVCNTMVTENAVAYIAVSEMDANAHTLVRRAVQVRVFTLCLDAELHIHASLSVRLHEFFRET